MLDSAGSFFLLPNGMGVGGIRRWFNDHHSGIPGLSWSEVLFRLHNLRWFDCMSWDSLHPKWLDIKHIYIYIHVVWVVVQDFVEEFVQTSTDIQNTWNNTAVFGCVISHRCGNVVWERSFGIFCATVVQHAFALRVERREHSQFVFKWFQRAIWDLFEQLVLKPYPQSQSRSIGLCHCTPLAGCGAGWHISCLPPVVYLALQREFHTLVDHSSFGLLVRSSKTLRPTPVSAWV